MTHLTITTFCTSVIMNIFEGSKSCFYHNKNTKQSFVISCLSLWPLVGASLTTLRRSYMFSFDYQRKIYPWQRYFYIWPYFIFNRKLHTLFWMFPCKSQEKNQYKYKSPTFVVVRFFVSDSSTNNQISKTNMKIDKMMHNINKQQ